MKASLSLDRNMRIIGKSDLSHITVFDTHTQAGGDDSAPTPMEVMLQAMGACSFMDIVSILRKKKKTVVGLNVSLDAEQADNYPKVFTKVHLKYELISPDTEMKDLEKAIELSQKTYCSASAMFQRSGCEVTWDASIKSPSDTKLRS
jgi:putative redox protein